MESVIRNLEFYDKTTVVQIKELHTLIGQVKIKRDGISDHKKKNYLKFK